MNWIYKSVFKCRLCSNVDLEEIVDFGRVNLYTANTGVIVNKGDPNLFTMVPLTLLLCKNCSNMQLREVVNPNFLYKNFQYKTQVTSGLTEHFKSLANSIINNLNMKRGDNILDIGSNDGTFLSNFKGISNIVGIEPGVKVAAYANKRGINTMNAYFGDTTAKKLRELYGSFRVIFCANTIANIDNLDEIFDSVKILLRKNGYFILETQNGADVIERFLLDTVYHEHLSYFTYPAFKNYLEKKGFRVDHVVRHDQKGGSIQIWFTHKANKKVLRLEGNHELSLLESNKRLNLNNPTLVKSILAKKIKRIQRSLSFLENSDLLAFGASVGANTLLHLFCKNLRIKKILDGNPVVDALPFGNILLPVGPASSSIKNFKNLKILVLAYRYYDKITRDHKSVQARKNFIDIFKASK